MTRTRPDWNSEWPKDQPGLDTEILSLGTKKLKLKTKTEERWRISEPEWKTTEQGPPDPRGYFYPSLGEFT